MGYQELAAFGLLILGLALIVAEICIPSGGLITIFSVCCFLGSGWFAWQAWAQSSPGIWWTYVAGVIVLVPLTLGLALYILPRTSFGKRILLEAPTLDEVTPYQHEQQRLAQLIGKTGRTLTLLNPGGLVLVEGERMHAETRGLLLDPGVAVKVVAVKGNRIVIQPLPAGQPQERAPSDGEQPMQTAADEPPLDFDFPQS
ncbi:MAG TPA: NfeD family protein [Planctomycetaceae bacterium]|nr:NfeD family protein [Planctomycetaceae bacterium]